MNRQAPSIASATGTLVDSATKHVRVCRVAQDYITNWLNKPLELLRTDKLLHAVQKDDIFIGCGPPVFHGATGCHALKKAYAVGLGSLHDVCNHVKMMIVLLTFIAPTAEMHKVIVEGLQKFATCTKLQLESRIQSQMKSIPEFYFEGVALTTGHPHGHIGDTALSVLTGGMKTMRNGPFEMHAGDLVTWVWDFEIPFLKEVGGYVMLDDNQWARCCSKYLDVLDKARSDQRIDADRLARDTEEFLNSGEEEPLPDAKRRKTFFYDQNNNWSKNSSKSSATRRCLPILIPLPQDYTYILRKRLLGRCLSYGRPFDMTDILLSRQGL